MIWQHLSLTNGGKTVQGYWTSTYAEQIVTLGIRLPEAL
jgi:hypothetical protein